VTTDFTKAANGVDSQGDALSGFAAYAYFDPWGNTPPQGIYKVVSGGPILTNLSLGDFSAYTASYHGMAFNDRLSFVIGMRHSKLINTGRTDNSPTYGAIFEAVKGVHLFASVSQMSTFTNSLSVQGPGVLPSDNQHLLDNEKDKGWEMGVKTDFNSEEFTGTLSFYDDKRQGFVQLDYQKSISDPRNIGPNITVTQAQPYVNGGIQESAGMEYDLTWTPNRSFQLISNYAWQYTAKWVSDVTINPATPGALQNQTFYRRLIKSPKNRTNLIAKYNFSGGLRNLSVGGAWHWTDWYWVTASPQYWLIVPRENIFDVFATYSTKMFDVPTDYQLNVINLTNQINDITRSNGLEIRLSAGFKF
jgi:outer membrane receptor for ferric coprogen and ferric-rhodotorulic acid